MADHIVFVGSTQTSSMSACATAVQTSIAAEITAASPQPLQILWTDSFSATGPVYMIVSILRFQG